MFFFYNYTLAKGYIPKLPGGWFGTWSLIGAFALLPLGKLAFFNARGKLLIFFTLFLSTLVLVLIWSILHHLFGLDWQRSFAALHGSLSLIVFWFVFFFIGFFFAPVGWHKRILGGCLVIMALFTLVNVDPHRMIFNPRQTFSINEGVVSYQGFARSFAVTAVVLLGLSNCLNKQVAVIVVSIPTLFFLGARSEFYGFIFIMIIWSVIYIQHSRHLKKVAIFFVLISVAISVFAIGGGVYMNRQMRIFHSDSIRLPITRMEFLKDGWDDIVSSPIFGQYAGQMRNREFGSYIHNGLSAWRQFGFLGFILYGCLLVFSTFLAFRAFVFQKKNLAFWRIAFFMNVYVFILVIAAKSLFGGIEALAWGFTAGALYSDRKYR